MGVSIEAIYLFYCLVCAALFLVMSVLAGAALRSTKSQVRAQGWSVSSPVRRQTDLPLSGSSLGHCCHDDGAS